MLNFFRNHVGDKAAIPRYPGRDGLKNLILPSGLEMFDEARNILLEYGGMEFGDINEHAKIDPNVGADAIQDMRRFIGILGIDLYPLGFREHQDSEYLFVDRNGFIYIFTDVLRPYACTFYDALANILSNDTDRGVRERLQASSLFGKRWTLE